MSSDSGFKWSCFVSYRHGQGGLLKDFIEEFSMALENRLGIYGTGLKVFVDKERLSPSYSLTPGLAEAICQSVCMVVIYNNGYFDKNNPFCAREFCAMMELENERLRANHLDPKLNLIIPVMLRHPDHIPDEIYDRNPCDFSKLYTDPEEHYRILSLKDKLNFTTLEIAYAEEIEKIAGIIMHLYQLLITLDGDILKKCNEAVFPEDEKVNLLLEKTSYKPVFPLGKRLP